MDLAGTRLAIAAPAASRAAKAPMALPTGGVAALGAASGAAASPDPSGTTAALAAASVGTRRRTVTFAQLGQT
ncbi:MAG: hypothetical protein J0I36_09115, partial [Pandoraea sp.]|nr:hypothetical protein [Pandoraea sp.]